MEVNVLGTKYEVLKGTEKEYPKLTDADGYCAYFEKKLYINDLEQDKGWKDTTLEEKINRTNQVIRHELIHAFLYESGLYTCCKSNVSWALNEEMVDWISIQMPKIMAAYESVINAPFKCIDVSFANGITKTVKVKKR